MATGIGPCPSTGAWGYRVLEAGNFIPADIRLVEAINLKVEEAALTGESLPVQKNAQASTAQDIPLGDRKNTVFMGTMVSYGRGKGVVVCTGMQPNSD